MIPCTPYMQTWKRTCTLHALNVLTCTHTWMHTFVHTRTHAIHNGPLCEFAQTCSHAHIDAMCKRTHTRITHRICAHTGHERTHTRVRKHTQATSTYVNAHTPTHKHTLEPHGVFIFCRNSIFTSLRCERYKYKRFSRSEKLCNANRAPASFKTCGFHEKLPTVTYLSGIYVFCNAMVLCSLTIS